MFEIWIEQRDSEFIQYSEWIFLGIDVFFYNKEAIRVSIEITAQFKILVLYKRFVDNPAIDINPNAVNWTK